ncbi:MAG: Flp pilus assembly complex ATPase component TadA [Erysipelotrichaceae bacterium]|nr:Flp pilus assembly complex ATPase component TadA [Erysipelotrichaceae bacterium]
MFVQINETLFGDLWPYVEDDNVTDIKWNGTQLWITDLYKGRYMLRNEGGEPYVLDPEFIEIFCKRIANMVNENFNMSEPSLKAETIDLRIQAEHNSVSGDDTIAFTIRKTPCVSRLAGKDLVEEGYCNAITQALLPCLMRAHCSGVITGDVGAGKTELEKYMSAFIPDTDGIVTVEDTLEMRLKTIYPDKDIYSMRITDSFTQEMAIKDALRLLTKWLIIAESRGRDIARVMEGASTGCCALTSIHAENTWEIPDRIMNMAGEDARAGFENDVFTFFDYAIKVKATIDSKGVHRKIDQISFFERNDKENRTVRFMINGKLTGNPIPMGILEKIAANQNDPEFQKYEAAFLRLYKKEIELVRSARGGV